MARSAGFFNLRDIGGHASGDGRSVRRGLVFRADAPRPSDGEGLSIIRGLGTRTLVDLRSDSERKTTGSLPEDLEVFVRTMPMVDEVTADLSDWKRPERAAAIYLDMFRSGGAAVGAALRVLADPEALPAMFYCTAGKDRTGIVSALLLGALGVDDSQIADDYAASTAGTVRLLGWYRELHPEAFEQIESFVPMFTAWHDTMLIFLELVRTEFGSPRASLELVGVDVDQLQDALLG